MTQEWREPVREIRTDLKDTTRIAIEAHADASEARRGLVVMGRHIEILETKVESMGKDIATIKQGMEDLPAKTQAKILWWVLPFLLSTTGGLAILVIKQA